MPISRVMNNPDGSTPVPPIGGGDVNGTLATSILGAQAGGATGAGYVERHQHFQTSALGIPSATIFLDAQSDA